jgi:hypothetical protein
MLPDNEQTSRMDNIYIAPTPSSPEVDFRFDTHTLSLRGESYPENAAAFYGQFIERLKAYLGMLQNSKVEVNIALAYFNSSSTKMLFNLIAALDEAAEAGNHIALNWFHDEEDDTIFEFGQELCEDFPAIHFVNHPVRAV